MKALETRHRDRRDPRGHRAARKARKAEENARRAARRAGLLEAAVAVIRREGPGASMEQMASEAGVTKPILYRHFGHKDGVYQAVAERYASELLEELRAALGRDAPPRDLLVATLDAYLSFLERETQVHRFLVHRVLPERPDLGVQLAGFHDQVASDVARLVRDRLKPAGIDTGGAEAWAYALVGMACFAGEWWIESATLSREHLLEYLTTLVWDGFAGIVHAGMGAPGGHSEQDRQ